MDEQPPVGDHPQCTCIDVLVTEVSGHRATARSVRAKVTFEVTGNERRYLVMALARGRFPRWQVDPDRVESVDPDTLPAPSEYKGLSA